jgi:endoglucanase
MKILITSLSVFLATVLTPVAFAQDTSLWERYKTNFVNEDGRVVDYYQGLISHSEGQGYGMQLSVKYGDRATFEKIWNWTKNNLQVRADHLSAWQWGQRPNKEWNVIDYNNATDGDILIAHALLKANEKWHDTRYKGEALKIIQDIRMHLSVTWQERTFLLPGYYGFEKENGFVVNPSHVILPAFRFFAQADQKSFWEKIAADGLFLLERSCFGTFSLPADWVLVKDGRISVYPGRNPYYGSDAIRILLHLSSEKTPPYPPGIGAMLDIYKKTGYIPLWADVDKDSLSLQSASAGYYAVYALYAKRRGDDRVSEQLLKEAREKLKDDNKAYYSFSLYLLATDEDSGHAGVSGL